MPRPARMGVSDMKHFRPLRRAAGSYFSAAVGASAEVKFACVISKKAIPRAVDRNTVRRRVRAVFARAYASLPRGAYVFYAKKAALGASFPALETDLMKLIARL